MTDIEALRARMRELAKAVVAASEVFDGSKEAEASLDAANAEFDLACTADRILALDAYTTRLREDLDRVTRERDEALSAVQSIDDHPDARGSIEANKPSTMILRARKARVFPTNTCPASRHTHLIADTLIRGRKYEMIDDEPVHVGQSLMSTVTSLFEARTALAKRDEEVARLRETMRAASVYLRKLEDNMLANDADMMLDDCLPPSFHADQIDQALTKEPPHAG